MDLTAAIQDIKTGVVHSEPAHGWPAGQATHTTQIKHVLKFLGKNSLCAIKKDRNALYALEKFSSH